MENSDNITEPQIKYNLSYTQPEGLSDIIHDKRISFHDSIVVMDAGYFPSVEHSERFCDITGDPNPIHRSHPKYGEALSPALLQNAVASVLIRELMKESGKSALDHPFLLTKSYLKGPVITGFDYDIKVALNPTFQDFYSAYTEIKTKKGKKLFVSHQIFYEDDLDRSCFDLDKKNLVHSAKFTGKKVLEFGNLIGSKSSESNLYALSASSFAIVSAINKGIISLDQGVCAMYSEQEIAADISSSLDLKKGISLELYLSDKERFGKNMGEGETLDMQIIGKDNKDKVIYISRSPIAFPRSRLLEVQIQRAIKSAKR